jgi:biotin transport system substrate-specific component
MSGITLTRFHEMKQEFYAWRITAGSLEMFLMALLMALLTALSAQVRIPLPWTLIPITGQVLSVFAGAVILGKRWGGISMILYIAMGLLGLPVFTGMKSGMAVILGPTGGYIIGFIMAAFFIGSLGDGIKKRGNFFSLFFIMAAANFIFIHGIGLVQLAFWTSSVAGKEISFTGLLMAGSIPFIAGDLIKIAAAAGVGYILSNRRDGI